MKRYPGMNIMRGMLLGLSLIAAACGGEKSVASKSAEAYREAQAKGIPVGGGHEHGGHAATSTSTAADHSAHGTTSDAGVAMDHSAHGAADAHAGMNHGATPASGAMDHSAHATTGAVDHAAMGHATTGRAGATDHAAMGHGTTPRAGATDHAAMGHGATPRAGATDHAAMGHGTTPSAPAAAHDQHAGMQPRAPATAADPHAQHAATTTRPPAMAAAAPRSNADMQRVQPAATLGRDAFDTPAPASVAEATKAAQGGGHEGHQMRGITPGEDRENPPTPMPATRDGSSGAPATDHSQHGAMATPQVKPAAATVYTCPMHPEVTSDKPGTCPKCGMALVKKNG